MPQPFSSAVITNGGAALLAKAQLGESALSFTRMVIGNGTYTDDEKSVSALQEMTALKSEQNSYDLASVTQYNEYSVKVKALLSNQNPDTAQALITSGYYINEIGLYAKEAGGGEDTEVLYSIAVTSGDVGDFMPPYNGYSPVQIIQEYLVTVSNSAEVTFDGSSAYALAEDLQAVAEALLQVSTDKENRMIAITAAGSYAAIPSTGTVSVLSPATTETLGGVIVGEGLTVTDEGLLSVSFEGISEDTAAALVEAGTEEMTEGEVAESYDAAVKDE